MLVDDHALVRKGLRVLLEAIGIEVVADAAGLTTRRRAFLQLIAAGHSTRAITEVLTLSV